MIQNLVFTGYLAIIIAPFAVVTGWLCWELERAYDAR
jgi:hypothetical protein